MEKRMTQSQSECLSFYKFMVSIGAVMIICDAVSMHFFLSGLYPMLENKPVAVFYAIMSIFLVTTGAFLIAYYGRKWNRWQQNLHSKEKNASM